MSDRRDTERPPGWRTGRTPKPVDTRRSEILRVRLTVPEFDATARLARRHDLTLAQVLRCGLRVLLKQPAPPDGA